MKNLEFSHRRCRATRKPEVICKEVYFYVCEKCDAVIIKSNVIENTSQIYCCDTSLNPLIAKNILNLDEYKKLSYKILGGHNDNTIEISWQIDNNINTIEWIYLKTYQGGYLKYISDNKKSKVNFALADDDAFAYCDESPCIECVFWCKRGFSIYAFDKNMGLINIPINKASPYWQTK